MFSCVILSSYMMNKDRQNLKMYTLSSIGEWPLAQLDFANCARAFLHQALNHALYRNKKDYEAKQFPLQSAGCFWACQASTALAIIDCLPALAKLRNNVLLTTDRHIEKITLLKASVSPDWFTKHCGLKRFQVQIQFCRHLSHQTKKKSRWY